MIENAERWIARTTKHEHKVAKLIELPRWGVDDLPRFGAIQEGWVNYCGAATWIGSCPTCGASLRLMGQQIQGLYSEVAKCDARCTSARGNHCECQCAGKNHGSDHAA